MIQLAVSEASLVHDLEEMLNLFFPREEKEGMLCHSLREEAGVWHMHWDLSCPLGHFVWDDEAPVPGQADEIVRLRLLRREAKLALYHKLIEVTGASFPWGSLTGIRPTKLIRQLEEEAGSEDAAASALRDKFDVSEPKIRLLRDILDCQRPYYEWGREDLTDVYLGIPFCRTRCLYCSFVSTDLSHPAQRKLVDPYVEAVLRDIEVTEKLIHGQGKRVRTMYVGGGTPSSIGSVRLGKILDALGKAFPEAWEWTVEAGRPDTMDPDLLHVMKSAGVGRISVNPQTMQAETLKLIGRDHTPEDVLRVLDEARREGFDSINADLIMGLPGENEAMVENTLAMIRKMPIENLTVHTLAVKRSSRLHEFPELYVLPRDEEVSRMVDAGAACARDMGMRPYYMYRQKHMTGNLENVGYALPGKVCAYNIDMMEETHHIVAIGAGAISKRMYYAENRHERFPHPKNPAYYIENLPRLLEEKAEFFQFND